MYSPALSLSDYASLNLGTRAQIHSRLVLVLGPRRIPWDSCHHKGCLRTVFGAQGITISSCLIDPFVVSLLGVDFFRHF